MLCMMHPPQSELHTNSSWFGGYLHPGWQHSATLADILCAWDDILSSLNHKDFNLVTMLRK